ncbi:MAG: 4Fe-4S dicluster domain-containing protein [Saprospiraceae bacterium]|nr:4Fe-4S dicluster domain-containing protein [Saprospiraceae bacterium]
MKYGFVIDNRKCIGCHACTTACKSEHAVPVGVNRTWVKQVEKGTFPNTRRLFSVMRCNHCTDAPCVDICPVEALFVRDDGIVDFDKRRCIGCKSCIQACPYDALYIDPDTQTAAKCNYCAHRIDLGLEPACVNVCPEHAIISGDMEDPDSEISQLLGRQQVSVRKSEKGTQPNLFYIDGDESSLNPVATEKSDSYFWSAQTRGVGHYAKAAEKMAFSNGDVVGALMEIREQSASSTELASSGPARSIDLLLGRARRVYDSPDKGILWGWEVSAYVFTKAIATGAFLVLFYALTFMPDLLRGALPWWGLGISLTFLGLTGILLIKDLDRARRFLYVLLRPQWKSWLVKGGYAITFFGAAATAWGLSRWYGWSAVEPWLRWTTAALSLLVAVYTAFLFAQAKGRDFWQSPLLPVHMFIHSLLAGGAVFSMLEWAMPSAPSWSQVLAALMVGGIALNLVVLLIELATGHATVEAEHTAGMITGGRYRYSFWLGSVLLGNILPLLLLLLLPTGGSLLAGAGLAILIGIYITEHIWVEAPQRIPLS